MESKYYEKKYNELIENIAKIRESMPMYFFIDNEGYDRLDSCIGCPLEVLEVVKINLERYGNIGK